MPINTSLVTNITCLAGIAFERYWVQYGSCEKFSNFFKDILEIFQDGFLCETTLDHCLQNTPSKWTPIPGQQTSNHICGKND